MRTPREQQLLGELDKETSMMRRQELLKELWRIERARTEEQLSETWTPNRAKTTEYETATTDRRLPGSMAV